MPFGLGLGLGLGAHLGRALPIRAIGTKFGPNGGGSGNGYYTTDASHMAATSRLRIDMPSYDVELRWVEYWNGRINFTGNGEVDNPNAISVKAAWESAAGVNSPLYDADGVTRTKSLASGARQRFYPASRIVIPGGSLPFVRQFVSVGTSGHLWPLNRICHNSSIGESENTFGTGLGSDQTDATGTFGSATYAYGFGPCGIYGVPADGVRRKVVALFQDSIGTVSGGDGAPSYGDANGYAGWIERKIGSQIATINAARSTSRLQYVAAGMANQLALIGPYVTSAIIQLGRNDVSNNRTAAQMQADFTTIATALQGYGVNVFASTITPRPATTSNSWLDGGATLTAAFETERNAYNTWLKTLPVGIKGCFDPCAYVEDSGRPGYWVANNPAYTTDGTHLSVGAMTAAGQCLDLDVLI